MAVHVCNRIDHGYCASAGCGHFYSSVQDGHRARVVGLHGPCSFETTLNGASVSDIWIPNEPAYGAERVGRVGAAEQGWVSTVEVVAPRHGVVDEPDAHDPGRHRRGACEGDICCVLPPAPPQLFTTQAPEVRVRAQPTAKPPE